MLAPVFTVCTNAACGADSESFVYEYDGSLVCSECGTVLEHIATEFTGDEDEFTGRGLLIDRPERGETDWFGVQRRVELLVADLSLDNDCATSAVRFCKQIMEVPRAGMRLESCVACAVLIAVRAEPNRPVLTLREVSRYVRCTEKQVGQRWLQVGAKFAREAPHVHAQLREALQPSQLLERYATTLRQALLREAPPLTAAAEMLGPSGALV
eukprot:4455644-Prymnesium_polylepis.1